MSGSTSETPASRVAIGRIGHITPQPVNNVNTANNVNNVNTVNNVNNAATNKYDPFDPNQSDTTRSAMLQKMMNDLQKVYQLLTNMMKSMHDMGMAAVRNIR